MTQKVATADVTVRVTSRVVVNVEQPMIQVLVVITTRMQTRVTRIEIPVIVSVYTELNPGIRLLYQKPQGHIV